MRFLQYETGTNDIDRRLDRVLRRFLPELGLSEMYKALRKGFIRINNKKTSQNYHIAEGDIIFIADFLTSKNSSTSAADTVQKNTLPLEVLFKNDQILIINKPYDIPVQKARKGELSLDDTVRTRFPPSENSLSFSPGPLHRLDKKTTGVLCFSQNLQGARIFGELLQSHQIQKKYLALLCGQVTEKHTWTDYIEKNTSSPDTQNSRKGTASSFHTVSVTTDTTASGKKSTTIVTPLVTGFFDDTPLTLAEITILTGRTHQIRSQCASHGYPLLGDTAYGGKSITAKQDFFLHSYSLTFPEGILAETEQTITASLPPPFFSFISKVFSPESLQKIDFLPFQSYNNIAD